MPVTLDAHGSYYTLPFDSWQQTQRGKRATAPVAALSLRMAETSGFSRIRMSMNKQRFTSVWDAIEDTPEQAANMKLRSVLMIALKDHITRTGMSQAQAAQLFGVTQPRVSDLIRGKINLFALDALVNMATAAGLRIEMQVLEAA
jgi:predicted XRE-type DNA-binding protein